MCSNYEPVTDNARLLATFGVSMPDGLELAAYSSAGIVAPFIVRSKVRVPGVLGDARFGILGLLPSFAPNVDFARQTYNCRAETMKLKPAFKASWWAGQRCVIPVSTINEWCHETRPRRQYGIKRADGEPMGLAGLWNEWISPIGERVMSFCMLTINATGHAVFQRMNSPDEEKRMPVILTASAQETWLYGSYKQAEHLLVRFPADQLSAEPLEPSPKPLKEPTSWIEAPDMFQDEWRVSAAEMPRKRAADAKPALPPTPPKPPEAPGPMTGDLFG